MLTISIISHQHGFLLSNLVLQLQKLPEVLQIIITINTSEQFFLPNHPNLLIINNITPKGFASNHNAAFKHCNQPYFCVLNPDIEFTNNPFPQLLKTIETQKAALIAPKILSANYQEEDSIRTFPNISSLIAKLVNGFEGRHTKNNNDQTLLFPDWVAGMFMLFRSNNFANINGFDEHYHLYYEDVDICARLHKANQIIIADLNATAIHHAQRASHKNLRYMRWHLTSMIRYLWTHRDL